MVAAFFVLCVLVVVAVAASSMGGEDIAGNQRLFRIAREIGERLRNRKSRD